MKIRLLNQIHSPEDVKHLSRTELDILAQEIRETLVQTTAKTGGHLASNLGVVELTIALERCFDSPKDSIVWDVGHQCYTHKLLTGRYDRFSTLRQNHGISGFPNPKESEHDVFAAGHSGTSIAASYGLSVAKTLKKDPSYTVAVIGDGSFTGGLVYEALNNAGHSNTRLIVILNENDMSISKNVGALARYLTAIRTNPKYYRLKGEIKDVLHQVPVVGDTTIKAIVRAKKKLKNTIYSSNFFEDLGFTYMGPIDGHDIDALCNAMESAKDSEDIKEPVLIHIHTVKGKGYPPAEENPSKFHGISQFDPKTGEVLKHADTNFSNEFGKSLVTFAEQDERICAITAAMTLGTGLQGFAKRFPNRFFDVGIAEEFGATFAGGLAKGGMIPVFAVYSTFLQRAYDEIAHDVSMQDLKVVFAVDRAGFVGDDGRSHQGIFDIAFLRTIPNCVIYSPSSYKGLTLYLYRALYDEGKVIAVRYPRGQQGYLPEGFTESYDDYQVIGDPDAKVCLITFGGLFSEAAKAGEALKKENIPLKIIKLNKIFPVNEEAVKEAAKADQILFFEEGAKSGGIGEVFASLLLTMGYRGRYSHFAVDNTFVDHAPIPVLRQRYHLDSDSMVEEVHRSVQNLEK